MVVGDGERLRKKVRKRLRPDAAYPWVICPIVYSLLKGTYPHLRATLENRTVALIPDRVTNRLNVFIKEAKETGITIPFIFEHITCYRSASRKKGPNRRDGKKVLTTINPGRAKIAIKCQLAVLSRSGLGRGMTLRRFFRTRA